MFKAGTSRLGKTVFDLQKAAAQAKANEAQKKQQKRIDTYNAYIKKANAVYAERGRDPETQPKWTVKCFKSVLNTLRRPEDKEKLPKTRPLLLEKWLQWKDRTVTPLENILVAEEEDEDEPVIGVDEVGLTCDL